VAAVAILVALFGRARGEGTGGGGAVEGDVHVCVAAARRVWERRGGAVCCAAMSCVLCIRVRVCILCAVSAVCGCGTVVAPPARPRGAARVCFLLYVLYIYNIFYKIYIHIND